MGDFRTAALGFERGLSVGGGGDATSESSRVAPPPLRTLKIQESTSPAKASPKSCRVRSINNSGFEPPLFFWPAAEFDGAKPINNKEAATRLPIALSRRFDIRCCIVWVASRCFKRRFFGVFCSRPAPALTVLKIPPLHGSNAAVAVERRALTFKSKKSLERRASECVREHSSSGLEDEPWVVRQGRRHVPDLHPPV